MQSQRSIMRNRGSAATYFSRRHRVQLHRLRELPAARRVASVSLPLFHAAGCDLAIGDEGLPSFMVSRWYQRPRRW